MKPLPMTFRKKPVAVQAIRYNWQEPETFAEEAQDEIADFVGQNIIIDGVGDDSEIEIKTNHGAAYAAKGDWIIKTEAGECYPCSDAEFRRNYEQVEIGGAA